MVIPHLPPYSFIEILDRDENRNDSHGPHRIAIIFLYADGIASYDALFCQEFSIKPPFAVLIQDHGFGGNYDRYDKGSLSEDIALNSNCLPGHLLIAEYSKPWQNYEIIPGLLPDQGGMHNQPRFLYKLVDK